MWKPYLAVIAKMAGAALNVLDPFHVAQHLNHAVDLVRRGEAVSWFSGNVRKRSAC
ncbi:MAG: transposase [Verrucomicrobiales bacterium]